MNFSRAFWILQSRKDWNDPVKCRPHAGHWNTPWPQRHCTELLPVSPKKQFFNGKTKCGHARLRVRVSLGKLEFLKVQLIFSQSWHCVLEHRCASPLPPTPPVKLSPYHPTSLLNPTSQHPTNPISTTSMSTWGTPWWSACFQRQLISGEKPQAQKGEFSGGCQGHRLLFPSHPSSFFFSTVKGLRKYLDDLGQFSSRLQTGRCGVTDTNRGCLGGRDVGIQMLKKALKYVSDQRASATADRRLQKQLNSILGFTFIKTYRKWSLNLNFVHILITFQLKPLIWHATTYVVNEKKQNHTISEVVLCQHVVQINLEFSNCVSSLWLIATAFPLYFFMNWWHSCGGQQAAPILNYVK